MDDVIQKLQDVFSKHPESSVVQDTLSHLTNGRAGQLSSWDILRQYFDTLTADGLWEKSAENEVLLDRVQAELRAQSNGTRNESDKVSTDSSSMPHSQHMAGNVEKISIVSPPPISGPLRPLATTTWLPVELLDVLNHAYFLHILATDAGKVLPPGKSLLSVMSRASSVGYENAGPTLQARVEDLVHKAFWDEALESLSSPSPAVQLPRLKRLYEDLHDLLASLLPPRHPVLVTLSSPLSPTSAPLRSAVTHLREVLQSLRERCAPARDPTVNALMQILEDPPTAELPRIIVETVRDTLKFAETMKEDVSQFVLGSMGEAHLQGTIRAQAQEREHELVTKLWGPERISVLGVEWVGQLDQSSPLAQLTTIQDFKWIYRLVQALGSTSPVSCNIPVAPSDTSEPLTPPNPLPPSFFFVAPTLLNIQNYLQALVIAATLRSLVRLPRPTASTPDAPAPAQNFMRRIWTLLSDEIDMESGDTKLINLADEIIRVRRLVGGSVGGEEETQLRGAVDRTLQPADPVFQLLQKRLLQSVAERLVTESPGEGQRPVAPAHLQSGRGVRSAQKPEFKLALPGVDVRNTPQQRAESPLVVKGFEDDVLVGAVTKEVEKLRGCIRWTEEVWADVVTKN